MHANGEKVTFNIPNGDLLCFQSSQYCITRKNVWNVLKYVFQNLPQNTLWDSM